MSELNLYTAQVESEREDLSTAQVAELSVAEKAAKKKRKMSRASKRKTAGETAIA